MEKMRNSPIMVLKIFIEGLGGDAFSHHIVDLDVLLGNRTGPKDLLIDLRSQNLLYPSVSS